MDLSRHVLCYSIYAIKCFSKERFILSVVLYVYAVGTYADPMDMAASKPLPKEDRVKAFLDPPLPRTIRIVMNRGLSIDKYTSAIVEALEPRVNGQDLQA